MNLIPDGTIMLHSHLSIHTLSVDRFVKRLLPK